MPADPPSCCYGRPAVSGAGTEVQSRAVKERVFPRLNSPRACRSFQSFVAAALDKRHFLDLLPLFEDVTHGNDPLQLTDVCEQFH